MKIPECLLQNIAKNWNLAITATAVDEIVRVSDSYQRHSGDAETFKDVVLGTDLYLLRSIIDSGRVNECVTEGALSSSSEIDSLKRPLFCQVVHIVDVTQPKGGGSSSSSMEFSGNHPLYKVTLTTGYISFYALLLNTTTKIVDLAPGTKVLLTEPKVLHMDSMAILYPKDYSLLGGKVMTLYRSWEVEREVTLLRKKGDSRRNVSDAPRFEPLNASCQVKLEDKLSSLALRHPPKPNPPRAHKTGGGPAKTGTPERMGKINHGVSPSPSGGLSSSTKGGSSNSKLPKARTHSRGITGMVKREEGETSKGTHLSKRTEDTAPSPPLKGTKGGLPPGEVPLQQQRQVPSKKGVPKKPAATTTTTTRTALQSKAKAAPKHTAGSGKTAFSGAAAGAAKTIP